jgi:predicted AAA+ superfamily ATPase
LYFSDTGLLCFLLNIQSLDELLRSPLLGSVWETFVYAELRKYQRAHQGSVNLFFYRDRSREIDFVVPKGGRFDLYEVKWKAHPDRSDVSAFKEFELAVDPILIDSKKIICRTSARYWIDEAVLATNLQEL